jgi:meiotically up-regulated gene 157 (Mug157) protein
MERRKFLAQTVLASAAITFGEKLIANPSTYFPTVRTALSDRKFTSPAVENLIKQFHARAGNQELAWLFENCFPNTLDTTVDFSMNENKPDTYVITGDIDAMWLRDSAAQVWPYLPLIKEDPRLGKLIAGVIHRQTRNILLDPYANAFYKNPSQVGEWKNDATDMKPGIHERKWEIDSLCYPIRLAYHYWKITGDKEPFDTSWRQGISLTLKTFTEQQRKQNQGPYKFERTTSWATDGVPLGGYGYPAKPIGLIHSMFRPSDDATIFPFLIPSNFFAAHSLAQAAEMLDKIHGDSETANKCHALATEISTLLQQYAKIVHPGVGSVYAYEINGLGSYNLMDDANVPSLLSLPYLGAVNKTDPIYMNTRNLVLSPANPFFFQGKAGEGIGGPHAGLNMIWPLSIVMRALTSTHDAEIKKCLEILQRSHGNTGFMHESFYKDDATKFTRKWFAWANTIFGELLFTLFKEKPYLLG